MPDPVRDEVPVAFVVAADPARPPTIDELDRLVRRAAGASRSGPRDITLVDELPRTSVGKIRKFLLKDPTAKTTCHDRGCILDDRPVRAHRPTCSSSFDALGRSTSTRRARCRRCSTPPTSSSSSSGARCSTTSGCASAASTRIPNPGDYFTATVNGEPLIVARDKDGAVHAFSAICQHRGMQVVDDSGNCSTFTCPYHHWIYGLDGRLLGAPAMERTAGFDKSDFGLPTLLGRGVAGLRVRQLRPRRRAARADARAATSRSSSTTTSTTPCAPARFTLTDLPWNWKVMFENFNDGYHANRLHQTIQDFCPSNLAAFPVPWDDALERDLPHQRLHAHRRRLQRHHEGAAAGVPRAHRGGALALDVRARPADAVPRHRARPGVLLHRPPEDGGHDRRRDRLPACTRPRSSIRCSSTCSR